MEVTEVRVRKIIEGNPKLKAIVSITLDNEFAVHDIKVVDGGNGLFVGMPSREIGGRFQDVAHPLNTGMRTKVKNAVLQAYYAKLAEEKAGL